MDECSAVQLRHLWEVTCTLTSRAHSRNLRTSIVLLHQDLSSQIPFFQADGDAAVASLRVKPTGTS